MGTHPIFESDFDCLTDMIRKAVSKSNFESYLQKAISVCSSVQPRFLDQNINNDPSLRTAAKHLQEALNYTLPGGKMTRGLITTRVFHSLADPDCYEWYEVGLRLGWAVELLQTCFLVADDIMDQSATRRGRTCWYKTTGLSAVNDALTIESCVYILLRSLPPNYPVSELVTLFQEVTFITEQGQTLDMHNSELPRVDISKFNMQNYSAIVKYKTSYYSFYLPFAAGMLAAGKNPKCEIMAAILFEMGHYFQVQDDYLDCFGDPNITGKIGTDIQDNKCTWLITRALDRSSDIIRDEIAFNYGKSDKEAIQRVKDIYNELSIPELFTDFEDESYDRIENLINNYRGPLDPNLFHELKNKLYKRSL